MRLGSLGSFVASPDGVDDEATAGVVVLDGGESRLGLAATPALSGLLLRLGLAVAEPASSSLCRVRLTLKLRLGVSEDVGGF